MYLYITYLSTYIYIYIYIYIYCMSVYLGNNFSCRHILLKMRDKDLELSLFFLSHLMFVSSIIQLRMKAF